MKTLCIIPCRKNSKRLPCKNSMPFNGGESLVARKIRQAIDSGVFAKIIVSSDDTICLNEAKKAGVIALKRPDYLATDDATTEMVVKHVLDSIEEMSEYTHLVVLQVTSPLFSAGHIKVVSRLLNVYHCDNVVSTDEQDKPNGGFYGISIPIFIDTMLLTQSHAKCFRMHNRLSVDIDTLEDFERAELIASEMEGE